MWFLKHEKLPDQKGILDIITAYNKKFRKRLIQLLWEQHTDLINKVIKDRIQFDNKQTIKLLTYEMTKWIKTVMKEHGRNTFSDIDMDIFMEEINSFLKSIKAVHKTKSSEAKDFKNLKSQFESEQVKRSITKDIFKKIRYDDMHKKWQEYATCPFGDIGKLFFKYLIEKMIWKEKNKLL